MNTFIPQISPIYWTLILFTLTISLMILNNNIPSISENNNQNMSYNNNNNPINW